jgi:hypothetical protein
LDTSFVNLLIEARTAYRRQEALGKPSGAGVGKILLESVVLLLSARLQAAVEDCFIKHLRRKFLHIKASDVPVYMKNVGNWGNPNFQNINKLFLRLGIFNVLSDFRVGSRTPQETQQLIDSINKARNDIAHVNRSPQSAIMDSLNTTFG